MEYQALAGTMSKQGCHFPVQLLQLSRGLEELHGAVALDVLQSLERCCPK